MSRIAFLTCVFARSHDVPPSRSIGGFDRAGVLLDQIEPFDRDEQLVFAGVAQLEELLHRLSPTPICFRPTNMPMP